MNKNNNQSKSTKGKANNRGQSAPKKGNMNGRVKKAPKQVGVAASYSTQQMGKSPQIRQSKDSIRIVHRELVGNVSGSSSSAFTSSQELEINPGIIATFPWLATIAQNWESYRMHRMRLRYYTRTSTSTVGSIIMAPDYDAADEAPSSEQAMSAYADVVEDCPWKDIVCELKPSSMHADNKRKIIRTGTLANNLDIKTYDVANLFVFTTGSATAAAWGKLWIEYDVELFTPQSSSALPVGIVGGRVDGATSMTGAKPFGTAGAVDAQAVGITYDGSGSVSEFTFEKVGTYLTISHFTGTVMSAATATAVSGCTVGTPVQLVNAAATELLSYVTVITTAPNAKFSLALTATTVTATILRVGCTPLNSLV